MSAQIEISTREQLFGLMKDKPKTITRKICSKCHQPVHRIFVKGQEKWLGCSCSKGRAHHYI